MQPTVMKTAVTNKSTFSTNLFFGINLHDAIFAVEIKTETPAVGKTKEKIRTIGIAPLKTHAYFVAQTITARHNRRILRLFQFPSRLNTLRTANLCRISPPIYWQHWRNNPHSPQAAAYLSKRLPRSLNRIAPKAKQLPFAVHRKGEKTE